MIAIKNPVAIMSIAALVPVPMRIIFDLSE